MLKTLASRYGVSSSLLSAMRADQQRLQGYFFKPYNAMLRDFREGTVPVGPPFNFDAYLQQAPVVADSNSSKCSLSEIINQIPKLEHGTGGFIYTTWKHLVKLVQIMGRASV